MNFVTIPFFDKKKITKMSLMGINSKFKQRQVLLWYNERKLQQLSKVLQR